jgi:hypothetical protein
MQIKRLTRDDFDAYTAFRENMWPTYAVGGDWGTVEQKYIRNPHVRTCSGSGLYACIQSGEILGVMGAYPMPVTFEGTLHPGHMLADWAVLPRYQGGPTAGRLFQELLALPGRKYASCGTRESQALLSRRAIRIPAVLAAALLQPVRAFLLERLKLRDYALPSPRCAVPFSLPGRAETLAPGQLEAAVPADFANTAYVRREADFWVAFIAGRLENSALPLRLWGENCRGSAVIKLLDVGPLRHATLLAFRADPPTLEAVRRLARSLQEALRALRVCALLATEADSNIRHCLAVVGLHVVRRRTHWWAIPKPSDAFAAQGVRWWLTSADRDSHWGFGPPSIGVAGLKALAHAGY